MIVAVKVIVPANTGLEGELVTAMVGVPLPTAISCSVVGGSDA